MKKLVKKLAVLLIVVMFVIGSTLSVTHAEEETTIDKVVCTCGCDNKATDCLCPAAIEALKAAGLTKEDIMRYWNIKADKEIKKNSI